MMLNKNLKTGFVAIAGFTWLSGSALAIDCTAPQLPTIPSGESATQSQMDQAQAEVKSFAAESRDYLGCLKDKAAYATADERAKIENLYEDMATKVDSATQDMQQAAADFQDRASARLAEADAATQDEQDTITNMYERMVDNLKTASNKVKTAWQDFRDDTEEAE